MATNRPSVPPFDAVKGCSQPARLSPELVRYVSGIAGQAPSVHNTQPWHFSSDGKHFDVFADRARQLSHLDPDGRLLTISCGAAVHHAQLAIRGLGLAITTELLADPSDPDHAARLTVGRADAVAPTAGEWALLHSVSERSTYRGHFRGRLQSQLLEDLRAAVVGAGCRLYRVERQGQRAEVAKLVRDSNADLEADPAYFEELQRWRRPDQPGRDGIPRNALGVGRAGRAATAFPPRDFGLEDRVSDVDPAAQKLPGTQAMLQVEPDVLAVWTSRDGAADWLKAGAALSALLLTATCGGAAASLLDQPLELPPARRRLRAALGVDGPVQALLRIGYPADRTVTTPRRTPADTLKDNRTGSGRG